MTSAIKKVRSHNSIAPYIFEGTTTPRSSLDGVYIATDGFPKSQIQQGFPKPNPKSKNTTTTTRRGFTSEVKLGRCLHCNGYNKSQIQKYYHKYSEGTSPPRSTLDGAYFATGCNKSQTQNTTTNSRRYFTSEVKLGRVVTHERRFTALRSNPAVVAEHNRLQVPSTTRLGSA